MNDVLRLLKGYLPAFQFQGGQQKGGNFFYFVCLIHANHVKNIASKLLPHQYDVWKQNTIKLHENMKKIEIIDKLHQRKVKFSFSLPQKDLISLLQYEMHGIQ